MAIVAVAAYHGNKTYAVKGIKLFALSLKKRLNKREHLNLTTLSNLV
jgi:hypothetical protein